MFPSALFLFLTLFAVLAILLRKIASTVAIRLLVLFNALDLRFDTFFGEGNKL